MPSYNMWDSTEFQNYLSNIGYPDAFQTVTYPGMKQSITAAVIMHQDKMVARKNSFELYGADFILTEDFQPWLLEINSNPALFPSTPITAKMCPKVLGDVIKGTNNKLRVALKFCFVIFLCFHVLVVLDNANNSKAPTGSFELIYKENLTKLPPHEELELKGYPLKSDYFFTPEQETLVDYEKQEHLKDFGDDIKATLKNLLQIIHNEKHRRDLKHKSVGCGSLPHVVQ